MNKNEVHQSLKAVGIPVSVFCRKIDISQTAYYQWLHDRLNLTAEKEERILQFAKKLAEVKLDD